MAGKRKRQDTDTLEELDGKEVVIGDGIVRHQEQFHEWLADVLEILRG